VVRNIYVYLIVLFIVASSLCSSDLFIYKSLTPYFLYLFGISILLIYSGLVTLFSKDKNISFEKSIMFTAFLALYVLISGLSLSGTINSYGYFLIANCCFFMAIFMALKITNPDLKIIFNLMIGAAIVESVICILQYLKVVNSLNSYFQVTGTWENPNVTAMFMAMTIPSALNLFDNDRRYIKKTAPFILLLFIVVLFILQCRTALIGAIAGVIIVLNYKYRLYQKVKDKKNRKGIILFASFLFAIAIPAINYAYQAKKASADGRKLVWKISAAMVTNKPIFGYGYGSFEKNYNLFQSRYFKDGNGYTDEIHNAGFVRMGYNELIQNAVEGGFIGLLLLAGIWLSLLFTPIRIAEDPLKPAEKTTNNHRAVAYAGTVTFIVMSLFNFSIQAIPVMCLFVIYGAVLSVNSTKAMPKFKSVSMFRNLFPEKRLIGPYGLCFVLMGISSLYITTITIKDNLNNKQAVLLTKSGNYKQALIVLAPLSGHLNSYESYWSNYGNTLLANKDYQNAIVKYNKAKSLTSDPKIYRSIALCYKNTGDYANARSNLIIAKYMEPNHFTSRFALMNLYLKMNDTLQTINEARNIIELVPKISSRETVFFKNQANIIMQKLGYPYHRHNSRTWPSTKTINLSNRNI
jgi:O-antigen polymerase